MKLGIHGKVWKLFSLLLSLVLVTQLSPNPAQANASPVEPMVASSEHFNAGVKSDGTVVLAGDTSGFHKGAIDTSGWSGITQVAAGSEFIAGLESDGTVVTQGYPMYTQLDTSDWSGITQVAAGGFSTLVGLKSDGTVVATGDYTYGLNGNIWNDITQVAASHTNVAGLKSDGTVVVVGDSGLGELDAEDWTNITQIAVGTFLIVGLESDGTVVMAGWRPYGLMDVSGWSDITQISASNSNIVGLKSDGTVVATGLNLFGQLDIGSWSGVVQVASGGGTETIGLKNDGTVVATGDNQYGQLDANTWQLKSFEEGYNAGYTAAQAAYTSTIDSLNGQLADLNANVNSLNGQLAQKNATIDGLNDQMDDLNANVNSLNGQLAQKNATIDSLNDQLAGLNAQLARYVDITPPTGAMHVNDVWASNDKSVQLTLSGQVTDELSIARDGHGNGVSEAYVVINGGNPINLTLDDTGKFSQDLTLDAGKDSTFTISLYAADTNSPTPNQGLVDQVEIVSPKVKQK